MKPTSSAIAATVAVFLACTPFVAADGWGMESGDSGRTGMSGAVAGPGSGAILWHHDLPHHGHSAVAVAGGRVYATYSGWQQGGGIDAVDATTGHLLWRQLTDPIKGSAVVADGLVLVASHRFGHHDAHDDHGDEVRVLALDATTGSVQWEQIFANSYPTSPAVHDGRVFVGMGSSSDEGALHAMDLQTGKLIWSHPSEPAGSPLVTGGLVIFTETAGAVHAVDSITGKVRWQTLVGAGGETPSADSGIVVVLAEDGAHGLAADTGDLEWSLDVPVWETAPAAQGQAVITSHRKLNIVDLPTGEIVRTLDGDAFLMATDGTTIYANGYSGSPVNYDPMNWFIAAIDMASGQAAWRYPLANYTYAAPIVVDGILYQPYGDWEDPGGLVALDAGFLAEANNTQPNGNSQVEQSSNGIPFLAPGVSGALALVFASRFRKPT